MSEFYVKSGNMVLAIKCRQLTLRCPVSYALHGAHSIFIVFFPVAKKFLHLQPQCKLCNQIYFYSLTFYVIESRDVKLQWMVAFAAAISPNNADFDSALLCMAGILRHCSVLTFVWGRNSFPIQAQQTHNFWYTFVHLCCSHFKI